MESTDNQTAIDIIRQIHLPAVLTQAEAERLSKRLVTTSWPRKRPIRS